MSWVPERLQLLAHAGSVSVNRLRPKWGLPASHCGCRLCQDRQLRACLSHPQVGPQQARCKLPTSPRGCGVECISVDASRFPLSLYSSFPQPGPFTAPLFLVPLSALHVHARTFAHNPHATRTCTFRLCLTRGPASASTYAQRQAHHRGLPSLHCAPHL